MHQPSATLHCKNTDLETLISTVLLSQFGFQIFFDGSLVPSILSCCLNLHIFYPGHVDTAVCLHHDVSKCNANGVWTKTTPRCNVDIKVPYVIFYMSATYKPTYLPGLGSSTFDQVLKYTKYTKSCLLKSRWPYSMQSRFWVDKLKSLFQNSCFCSKVKMAIFYAE